MKVDNDGGLGDGEGGAGLGASPPATGISGSSLLEEVLGVADDVASIDDKSSTFMIDGVAVGKASVFRQLFGRGSPKSNDRLKRVRGIGRSELLQAFTKVISASSVFYVIYIQLSQQLCLLICLDFFRKAKSLASTTVTWMR